TMSLASMGRQPERVNCSQGLRSSSGTMARADDSSPRSRPIWSVASRLSSRIEAPSFTAASEVEMVEVDERTLAELRAVRDQLTRAELADDAASKAEAHARLAQLVDARVLGHLLATATPRPKHAGPIRLPVPYYGGKFGAAPLIERAMGPIVNLVVPFGGSLGCLLGRSTPAKVETANDKDGLIVNAWRAIKHDP